jgi:hypothetical protein
MTDMLELKLEAIRESCGSGCESSYYRLTNEVGIKLMRTNEDTAKTIVQRQLLGAERGWAPKVIGLAKVTVKDQCCFAVLTEHVPKLGNDMGRGRREDVLKTLQKMLAVDKLSLQDCHGGNYGVMADDKPVIVDCGGVFLHRWDTPMPACVQEQVIPEAPESYGPMILSCLAKKEGK